MTIGYPDPLLIDQKFNWMKVLEKTAPNFLNQEIFPTSP